MKKFMVFAAAVLFASASVFAQDLNEATDVYNTGASQLQASDYEAALTSFQKALGMAENAGEEGEEMVANCKNIIPSVILAIGKREAKDNNYDEAIAQIQEAAAVAEEYGNDEVVVEAEGLIPGLRLQKANSLLQAKDYEAAVAAYKDVIEYDADNGSAYLRLGQALMQLGNNEESIEALSKALELGEDAAGKLLANSYLKVAQEELKAKNYKAVIEACEQSNSYAESANAYKLAASASTQLGKSADAIGYYEKYLGVSPDAADANAITFTIAALYQQAGNKAKALEYYKKVENDAKYGEQAQAQIKALQ